MNSISIIEKNSFVYFFKKNFLLSLILCFSFFIPAMAQNPLPPAFKIISDTAAYILLPGSNWQLMSDVSGKLDLNEIINSKHFQNENLKINYKINVYWQRYKIINFLSTETKIAFPEVSFRADIY